MPNNIVTPAEIEERYEITQQTRSKWTKQYSKFLSPRGKSFHRTYTNDDIVTFDFIVECKNRHMTVRQIIALLEDGATEVPEIVEQPANQVEKFQPNQHTPPPGRRAAPKPENSVFASFGELKQRVEFISESQSDLEFEIDSIKKEMSKFHNRLVEIENRLGISSIAMYPSPETDIIIARR